MSLLDREEYIEQAYFFRTLLERMRQGMATQDLIVSIKEEILSTTKLPMAMDFLVAELRHQGVFSTAMAKLPHYFNAFQTYVIGEAEAEGGRFDLGTALKVLEREAQYRAEAGSRQGLFLYQFEALCRNRLGYDRGLDAMARDPIYDADWQQWLNTVRRQVGIVDFADLIYVRSEQFYKDLRRRDPEAARPDVPVLFGEKEGKIAKANRKKDPLLLFAALHRQLGYPAVPRLEPIDQTPLILPGLLRRMERLELRIKMLEEEQRGSLDINKIQKIQGELGSESG